MKLYLNSLLRGLAFAAVLSVGTAASAQVVKVNTDAAKKEVIAAKRPPAKVRSRSRCRQTGGKDQEACQEGVGCKGAAKAKAAAQQAPKPLLPT